MDPQVRRAALIATGVTVPLVLAIALLIVALGGSSTSDATPSPTGALTVSAPPQASAQAEACAKLLAVLPPQLGSLPQRVVDVRPEVPGVVAWGSPAVVLKCGAARPKDLQPGSSVQLVPGGDPTRGPWYDITRSGDANVWTSVDRGPYVSITVPSKYTADSVIVPLSNLIRKTLPTVCSTDASAPVDQLCTRRR